MVKVVGISGPQLSIWLRFSKLAIALVLMARVAQKVESVVHRYISSNSASWLSVGQGSGICPTHISIQALMAATVAEVGLRMIVHPCNKLLFLIWRGMAIAWTVWLFRIGLQSSFGPEWNVQQRAMSHRAGPVIGLPQPAQIVGWVAMGWFWRALKSSCRITSPLAACR